MFIAGERVVFNKTILSKKNLHQRKMSHILLFDDSLPSFVFLGTVYIMFYDYVKFCVRYSKTVP